MQSVPSASDGVDETAGPSSMGQDLPPSYQSAAVGMAGRKEKV